MSSELSGPGKPNNLATPDNLPEELELLSEQLGDDAERLASLYPAPECPAWMAIAEQGPSVRQSAGRWLSAAAAAGIVLATASIAVWKQAGADRQSAISRTESNERDPQKSTAASLAVAKPSPSNEAGNGQPTAAVPAGLFQALTGAEQEALIDLMEQDEVGQSSLSI